MARASTSQRLEHFMDADLTPGEAGHDVTERMAGPRPLLQGPDHRAHKAALAQALFGVTSDPVRIGRFRVLARLGEGGMGVVFAGHDDELDRPVAIKLLHVGGELGESRARLMREAQALARLSHPNVVALFEVGESQGQLFVAMEQVQGETLHAWIHAGPRPWPEVLAVFLAAGRGLAAAHAVGLVHRDFKPGNVMLGADGRVRVLDFGLARALAASEAPRPTTPSSTPITAFDTPLTMTGSVVGTPAYMAPEQLHEARSDPRSDQFSFCVALFEALHGVRPFVGATQAMLFAAIDRGEILRPPAGSRVPAWLHAAVVRGLARDPAARWPSMPALLAELTRDRHARRRRWTLAAVIGGLGLLPLGLGVAAGREHIEHSSRKSACEANGDEVRQVWNFAARAGLQRKAGPDATRAAIEGLQAAAATIENSASNWYDDRVAGCMRDPEGYVHPQFLKERHDHVERCFAKGLDDLRTTLAVAREVDPVTAGLLEQTEPFAADRCLADATSLGGAPEYPDDAASRRAWQRIRAEVLRARLEIAAGRPLAAEAKLVAAVAEARARQAKSLELEATRALIRAHFAAGHRRAAWSVFEAALAASPDVIDVHTAFDMDPLAIDLALGAATGKPRHTAALLLLGGSQDRGSLAGSEALIGVVERGARPIWRQDFPRLSGWIARAMLPMFAASAQLRGELGDFEGAEEFARNALTVSGFNPRRPALEVDLLLALAIAQQGLGRHSQAADALQLALAQVGTDADALIRLPRIHLALAGLALDRGALDEAQHELAATEALAAGGEADDDRLVPALTLALARLHAARGDHDGAEQLLQRARESLLASHGAARRMLVTAEVELARLALARSDLALAATGLATALRLNEALVGEAHASNAAILVLQAQVQRAQGQGATADATLERARDAIAGHQVAPTLRAAVEG